MALLTNDDIRTVIAGATRPLDLLQRLASGPIEQLTLPAPLPDPQHFLHNRELIWQRYDSITVLRQVSLFQRNDSPSRSIYRMCEFLSADFPNQLMLEMQYFWHHEEPQWTLAAIPDPRETNVERYAILASLVESLVTAFNARLALGLRRGRESIVAKSDQIRSTPGERAPFWTCKVPRLSYELSLYDAGPYFVPTDEPFSNRNIIANAGNLFSI